MPDDPAENGTPTPALAAAGQGSGTAVVAWTGSGQVNASVRTPSAGWSSAAVVSAAGQTATSPAAVLRPDGSVVLAWAAQRSADTVIESSVWTAAAGWSTPAVVSRTGMSFTGPVALGADGTGTAQLLWTVTGAEASSLPQGGSWTTPATAVLPGSVPFFLGTAPNGATDFAGWYDNAANEITAAVHTSAGWGTATQVSPPLGAQARIAAVSTAPVGNGALIAWISGTSTQGTVQVSTSS